MAKDLPSIYRVPGSIELDKPIVIDKKPKWNLYHWFCWHFVPGGKTVERIKLKKEHFENAFIANSDKLKSKRLKELKAHIFKQVEKYHSSKWIPLPPISKEDIKLLLEVGFVVFFSYNKNFSNKNTQTYFVSLSEQDFKSIPFNLFRNIVTIYMLDNGKVKELFAADIKEKDKNNITYVK